MIKSVIVDDEEPSRRVLQALLAKYCKDVAVVAEADTVNSAFLKITETQPDLVFLDIRMPGKSGFDLLKLFPGINFEVIFVSAFDEYAIKAFEFNALDYILKPIDYTKLVKAVNKAITKIRSHQKNDTILHFIQTLADKDTLINKLSVHHNGKVVFVATEDIVFIESKTDFCELYLQNGEHYTSSKDLKLFDDVLKPVSKFIRINKSIVLNSDFIRSYSKGELCIIELKSGHSFEVSRRKKTEIISKIKHLVS